MTINSYGIALAVTLLIFLFAVISTGPSDREARSAYRAAASLVDDVRPLQEFIESGEMWYLSPYDSMEVELAASDARDAYRVFRRTSRTAYFIAAALSVASFAGAYLLEKRYRSR